MGAITYPLCNVADAFGAQMRACEKVVQFARDMGFRCVHIEGDSLMTIKKINSNTTDRSYLFPIICDIKKLKPWLRKLPSDL